MELKEKILVVAAHPDDETLGMGATIAKHSGYHEVYVLILTDGITARHSFQEAVVTQEEDAKKACGFLGVKDIRFCRFPDQKLDLVPLPEVVSKISNYIDEIKPSRVYTHFWGDLNQDHRRTFEATSIAVRPLKESLIREFLCFETPTSTEWGTAFHPNIYEIISKQDLERKINAFKFYEKEQKDYLSPRSQRALEALARVRGAHINYEYAEGFLLIRKITKQSSPHQLLD